MDDEEGLICLECGEWVLVYTNAGSPGLCYCPCCGAEWKEEAYQLLQVKQMLDGLPTV
jgi:predicted amidophosphoribosyltransferase